MLDYNTIKNMTQEEYKQIKPMLSTHSDSDHEGITQAKKLGLVPGAKVRILFDICDDAIITVVTILVSIVSLVLIKPKDPFMVYETLKESSPISAYMYLSTWYITGITVIKALFNNIKISWR